MTWIDVVSDAIKIGLGAIIAAISAYVIANKNQRSEHIKLYLSQKREKLDKCIELLNSFHKKYTHYRADVGNFYRNKRRGYQHTQLEIENLNKKGEDFRLAFDSFVDLDGYLLATGETVAHEKLYEYMETLDEAKDILWHNKENVEESTITSLNSKVREKRKILLLEINNAFEPPQ